MKCVLHIGMPKTGSTSIQHYLAGKRDKLAEAGIVYPRSPGGWVHHGIMTSGMVEPGKEPRYLLSRAESADLKEMKDQFWAGVREQVDSGNASSIVLSSESLFRSFPVEKLEQLKSRLEGFGVRDIRVIAYVRRPSDYFASLVIQKWKASSQFPPLRVPRYTQVLTAYQSVFGFYNMEVVGFSARGLQGLDVVDDFVKRLDGSVACDLALPQGLGGHLGWYRMPRNIGLSAESGELLRQWRAAFHLSEEDRHAKESAALRKMLEGAEEKVGCKKPKLKPEIREWLDYSSREVLWLKDEYGVEFGEYDYSRAGELEGVAEPEVDAVDGLFEYDRFRELGIFCALHEIAGSQHPKIAEWADKRRKDILGECR